MLVEIAGGPLGRAEHKGPRVPWGGCKTDSLVSTHYVLSTSLDSAPGTGDTKKIVTYWRK